MDNLGNKDTAKGRLSIFGTKHLENIDDLKLDASDRSDIACAAKEMGRDMSSPSRRSWAKLKRRGRYLLGKTGMITMVDYQDMPVNLKEFVDAHLGRISEVEKANQ